MARDVSENTAAFTSAIGQGTHNYAAVQLARYVNTIASKGNVFRLSLIKGTAANGSVAENNSVLRDMQISIAGKTGTAQESKNRPDHALFVGYAPAKTPKITIAVRIANGYGSSNATAVGRGGGKHCRLLMREQIRNNMYI